MLVSAVKNFHSFSHSHSNTKAKNNKDKHYEDRSNKRNAVTEASTNKTKQTKNVTPLSCQNYVTPGKEEIFGKH